MASEKVVVSGAPHVILYSLPRLLGVLPSVLDEVTTVSGNRVVR